MHTKEVKKGELPLIHHFVITHGGDKDCTSRFIHDFKGRQTIFSACIAFFLAGRETSPMIVLSGDWLTDWFTEDM